MSCYICCKRQRMNRSVLVNWKRQTMKQNQFSHGGVSLCQGNTCGRTVEGKAQQLSAPNPQNSMTGMLACLRALALALEQWGECQNSTLISCRPMCRDWIQQDRNTTSRGSLKHTWTLIHRTCLLSEASWKHQTPNRHFCTFCAEMHVACKQGFPIKATPSCASPLLLVSCETEFSLFCIPERSIPNQTEPVRTDWFGSVC